MYIAGIDAGGSKTECIIWDTEREEVAAQSRTGPANYQVVGLNKAVGEIKQALKLVLNSVGLESIPLVGLGIAGAGREEDINRLKARLNDVSWINKFVITDDGRSALLGATGGHPGMILIAGTGSIAYGLREDGGFIRSGGWGPILGDEGSGFWLGLKAIKLVIRASEGRAQRTSLTDIVKEELKIDKLSKLVSFIHKGKLPRKKIAALVPSIIKEAENDDQSAKNLVDTGIEELLLLVKSIKARLDYNPDNISVCGGLFNSQYFYQLFAETSKNRLNLNSYKPLYSAKQGAVFYAQRKYKGEENINNG